VAHQCVLEVANPLVRVEAAVSHLDTLSLSFFFFSQKQASVQASSTTQCLTTASEVVKHILFGFYHFSRSDVILFGVKWWFKEETFLSCVCVASVVCVPRARPRDPEPVTPSPLSPPCASRALCALRDGTKCVSVDLYVCMCICLCLCVLRQQLLCASSCPTPWPTHPACAASRASIMCVRICICVCVCMRVCVCIHAFACVCVLCQRALWAYSCPTPPSSSQRFTFHMLVECMSAPQQSISPSMLDI
jgi:hypothetical protein